MLPQTLPPAGTPSIVTQELFMRQFKDFTLNLFEGFDWSNAAVIGGAVVASLLPHAEEYPMEILVYKIIII